MRKLILVFILLILCDYSSAQNLTYGIKGGMGFWKFMSLEDSPATISPKYPYHSYPVGFSLGFFIENQFNNHFSIICELLYQNSSSKVTIDTPIEGYLDQKVTNQFLNLPILLKYYTPKLWNTYFFLGPSFAYLIKANYNYIDQFYPSYKGDVEITKNLPAISTSVEFGLGKVIELSGSTFMIELRAQLGLTKFQFEDKFGYYDIGKWRNAGLIFMIGYKL